MTYCNDCGHEITADTSTVHCSSRLLGCYYAGPAICLHCAKDRYEAITRQREVGNGER